MMFRRRTEPSQAQTVRVTTDDISIMALVFAQLEVDPNGFTARGVSRPDLVLHAQAVATAIKGLATGTDPWYIEME
jgi:hypothetical protein